MQAMAQYDKSRGKTISEEDKLQMAALLKETSYNEYFKMDFEKRIESL